MLDFGTVSYVQLCERRKTLLYFTLSCVIVGRRFTGSNAQLCERRKTLLYLMLSCVNVGRRYCILRSVV